MKPERILFVDVQASGNPGNGFLLEVAWKESGGGLHSFLVRNIGDKEIPFRVKRITGISEKELKCFRALDPMELKKLFLSAAGLDGIGSPLLLVAHYAVYEKRWLDYLTGLNLQFQCTREDARQKIPGLLSGTLRAVAGLAGYSLGEKRRARDHVLATEAVFEACRSGFCHSAVSREERLSLPRQPGVYSFLDPEGTVLYVGKAKNLRNRVNSHFTGKQRGRHAEMLCRTSSIEHRVMQTALHAAIRESTLISELSPQYNLAGRVRDKALWYLNASMEKISRNEPQIDSFGPFANGEVLTLFVELVKFINTESNKTTIVHNPWSDVPETLFLQSAARWREAVSNCSILNYGLSVHMNRIEHSENASVESPQVIDAEEVSRRLDAAVADGCLQCRRSAACRLLEGSEVLWDSESGESLVHKFVENSVNGHWSKSKLQNIRVLLGEIRRLHSQGKNPRILTRFNTIISDEALSLLLQRV